MSEFYITEKAIARRATLLRDVARELLESGTLPPHRIILREPRIRLLTEGYFLLNKAYKDWRIPEGHSNEKIRIAALQALTITQFQPFVPVDPSDARDLAEARCNEIFALVYALAMMDVRIQLGATEKIDPCLSGCHPQATSGSVRPCSWTFTAWQSSQLPQSLPEFQRTFSRRRGLRRLPGEGSLERRVCCSPLSGGGRAVPLRKSSWRLALPQVPP